MIRRLLGETSLIVLGAACLAGCANPYALRVSNLRYDIDQTPGSIQFSDPKLYKREALINERREEVTYLNELLDKSKTDTFKPEIARELEVISSLSAALGVRADPAAGVNYRRELEASELQQDMRLMRLDIERQKLELEKDQLARDAELFRKKLETQEAVSNTTLGAASTGTPLTPLASSVTAPTAAQLTTAINNLNTSLTNRFNAEVSAVRTPATAEASLADTFRDRAAYRSLLNTARNAASLDELHDKNGAALVRLSFTATVLPPTKDYQDTLGILRMEVEKPTFTPADYEDVYRKWLGQVNRSYNIPTGTITREIPDFFENPQIAGLAVTGDLFEPVYYAFPKSGRTQAQCRGATFDRPSTVGSCGMFAFAVPRLSNSITLVGDNVGKLGDTHDTLKQNAIVLAKAFPAVVGVLRGNPQDLLTNSCKLDLASSTAKLRGIGGLTVGDLLAHAFNTNFIFSTLSGVEAQARKTLLDNQAPLNVLADLERAKSYEATGARRAPELPVAEASALTEEFLSYAKRRGCLELTSADFVRPHVPARFLAVVKNQDPRVAVYDVGPREQTQRISTVARAADAIGLAAAISGQVPTAGIGADGNIAYSRAATGKADAIERAPIVVSFAEARHRPSAPAKPADAAQAKPAAAAVQEYSSAFGWLLGPKASLDPRKQKLVLEHQAKPFDLSVDVSVPGWWPYMYLNTETGWAPNWRNGTGQTMKTGDASRKVRVDLSPNAADLDALTGLLTGGSSVRLAAITRVEPPWVSPCADTQIQVVGENIWRATTVVVGGRKFEGDDVTVLPDMNGVLVSAKKGAYPAVDFVGEDRKQVMVTALTPYGPANRRVDITYAKDDGTCQPLVEPTKPEVAPVVTTLQPTALSRCVAFPKFILVGRNFKGLVEARLEGVSGVVSEAPPRDGTAAEATFSAAKLKADLAGKTRATLLVRTVNGHVEREIPIVAPDKCP